jgi:gamma-glutamylcyclotransferase (GGCT)/AIG2-like uncharacterized protein YtfP
MENNLLKNSADFVDFASYQGRLYLIDNYPGVVASMNQTDTVYGELYRLHNPDSALARLDAYEECGTGYPEPTEYIRQIQSVSLQNNETISAWVYLYNRPTNLFKEITSGDFLLYKAPCA